MKLGKVSQADLPVPGHRESSRGPRELAPEELRWTCPPDIDGVALPEVPPATGLVGQDRAARAIRFGLEVESPGYNIYVAGYPGTGRTTAVRDLIRSIAPRRTLQLKDRAYVANFKEPDRPVLLTFPAGQAARFREDIDGLVEGLKRQIPEVLRSDPAKRARAEAEREYRSRVADLVRSFEDRAKSNGFEMGHVHFDPSTFPNVKFVLEGQPVAPDGASPDAKPGAPSAVESADITRRQQEIREDLVVTLGTARELSREFHEKTDKIDRGAVSDLVAPLIRGLQEKYPTAFDHLQALGDSILRDLELFTMVGEPEGGALSIVQIPAGGGGRSFEDPVLKYRVNVIQDNAGRTECPIVFEELPSLANLVGLVELQLHPSGAVRASFMNIRGGALLQADGGFLVIRAGDILARGGSWSALKRVLKSGLLEIGVPESPLLPGILTMKPQPVEIHVKVILIGDPLLHDLLWRFDEDFPGIFKIKADFDSEMKVSPETIRQFASVLSKVWRSEKLPAPDAPALRRIVEEGMRRTGRRGRLTTRFSEAADLLREACYWARKESSETVTAAHVDKSLFEQKNRHALLEERFTELIDEKVLNLEVAGERVGQVNGLSIYDLGRHSFSLPTRITASVSMGRSGVISVERESGMSGRVHHKGVLTLVGFLRERFGQEYPLSLSASVAFEQSYASVEGDSASLAELLALLSALSGVPVRQSIAVTGSIDQKGTLQAVGGVNEKIEGFFKVCRRRGLTGEQGVLIPRSCANDLMLNDAVLEAVAQGSFHVWAADTVDDAEELILGLPSGARDSEGRFPPGSLNRLVDARLREFAEVLARYGRGP